MPPGSHEFFNYLNFSETPKCSQWIFSVLWYKNLSTEKHDILLSHPFNFFAKRKFRKSWTNPMIRWDQKNRRKNVLSRVLSKNSFFAARNFPKHRKVPNLIFQYCDTKMFRWKNVISSYLIHTNFLLPEIIWNNEEFSMKFFDKVREKKVDGKTL